MIMPQLTPQAFNILWCWGWEVFTSSVFFWPKSIWLGCNIQTEAGIAWEMICKQRGLLTALWCEVTQIRVRVHADGVHHIPHHRVQWNTYNFGDYIEGCLRVCTSNLCCMLFQIYCVHDSDTIVQKIQDSLASGSCVYVYIYIYTHTHTHTHTRC